MSELRIYDVLAHDGYLKSFRHTVTCSGCVCTLSVSPIVNNVISVFAGQKPCQVELPGEPGQVLGAAGEA